MAHEEEEIERSVDSGNGDELVPIRLRIPAALPTVFATEMAVQLLQGNVILSFFEVRLPITKDSVPESLDGYCVSRVTLPIDRITSMIDILQEQVDNIEKQMKELE